MPNLGVDFQYHFYIMIANILLCFKEFNRYGETGL